MRKLKRKLVQRPRRYPVNDNYIVRVVIERESEGEPAALEGQLLDLSPGGAKLALRTPIRFHEPINLSLKSPDLGLDLSVAGTVCWIRKGADDVWLLGCSFDPQLPRESLEQLFANGLLERRVCPRDSVRRLALAQWELNPGETAVGLLDLSRGGYSVLSPLPAKAGSRMRLAVESATGELKQILATVRWQMQVEGGYAIGCAFTHDRYYQTLEEILVEEVAAACGGSRWSLAVLLLLGLFALASWFYALAFTF